MKNALLLSLLSAGFWSCNRCAGLDCPYAPALQFKLIDRQKNVSEMYRQARLYSTTGEIQLKIKPSTDGSVFFFTETNVLGAATGSTFYLQLNANDTDTIQVDTQAVKGECCTSIQPTSLRFNGQETIKQLDADNCHLFVKK